MTNNAAERLREWRPDDGETAFEAALTEALAAERRATVDEFRTAMREAAHMLDRNGVEWVRKADLTIALRDAEADPMTAPRHEANRESLIVCACGDWHPVWWYEAEAAAPYRAALERLVEWGEAWLAAKARRENYTVPFGSIPPEWFLHEAVDLNAQLPEALVEARALLRREVGE